MESLFSRLEDRELFQGFFQKLSKRSRVSTPARLCNFRDLPLEIRELIYTYLLDPCKDGSCRQVTELPGPKTENGVGAGLFSSRLPCFHCGGRATRTDHDCIPIFHDDETKLEVCVRFGGQIYPEILRASKQTYDEALPILYRNLNLGLRVAAVHAPPRAAQQLVLSLQGQISTRACSLLTQITLFTNTLCCTPDYSARLCKTVKDVFPGISKINVEVWDISLHGNAVNVRSHFQLSRNSLSVWDKYSDRRFEISTHIYTVLRVSQERIYLQRNPIVSASLADLFAVERQKQIDRQKLHQLGAPPQHLDDGVLLDTVQIRSSMHKC